MSAANDQKGKTHAYREAQREAYSCFVVHNFKENSVLKSESFSPKGNSRYEWQLIGARMGSVRGMSFSLYPVFIDNCENRQIVDFAYTLTVEDSSGNLVNQWKVENSLHTGRDNVISHMSECHDSDIVVAEWMVHLSLTFFVLPMEELQAVPKKCLPVHTTVRVLPQTGRENHISRLNSQDVCHDFRSLWIISGARINESKNDEVIRVKSFSLKDNPDYSFSCKIKKGLVSLMVMTECSAPNNAVAKSLRLRYELTIESSRKEKLAHYSVDLDYSASFRLLLSLPLSDVNTSTSGNVVFHLTGSFINVVLTEDKKTDLSVTSSNSERQYYEKVLKESIYTDVILLVEDSGRKHAIPSHRLLLSAKSVVFRELLDNMQKDAFFNIAGLDLKCVQNMLNYMYVGKFDENMTQPETALLMEAAERFGLSDLKSWCELKLMRSVKISNALDLFQISEVCKAENLQEMVLDFIAENDLVGDHVTKRLRSENILNREQHQKLLTEFMFRRTAKMCPE